MSAPKHTPGPWLSKVKEKAGFIYCWVQNRDNYIADMSPAYVKNHGVDAEVMKANAALIAAAPELLGALKGMIEVFGDEFGMGESETVDRAMAAIAKAEGGAA